MAWAMPTAVFYNSENLGPHFGHDAVARHLRRKGVKLSPAGPAPPAQ